MGSERELEGSEVVWRRADGRPLKAFELKVYARAGLSPLEALEWADAGFEPYQTEQLREAGAEFETARRLSQLGLDHRHLRFLRDLQERSDDGQAAGIDGLHALLEGEARSLGVDDAALGTVESKAFFRQAMALRMLGVSASRVLAWRDSDLDLGACLHEIEAGVAEDDVAGSVAWQVFEQRATRRAWQATGLAPAEAKSVAANGYRPVDVLEGHLGCGTAERIPLREVLFGELSPQPRTVDGTPLPSQVLTELRAGDEAAVLRAFGYRVVRDSLRSRRDSLRSRFAVEHSGAIIIGFRCRRGRGMAAVESLPEGTRLSVLQPRRDSVSVTSHHNMGQAFHAFAASGEAENLAVVSVSSASMEAADLLRVAQPLASCLAEGGVTVNKLAAMKADTADGCFIVPAVPAEWPRHYMDEGGEVQAVGALYLTNVLRPAPVGWFDDPDAGLAAARSRVPLVMVERTGRDQRTVTTSVYRQDGALALIDGRGRRRRLGTDDPLEAVRQVGSLRNVNADEATAFFVSSAGPSVEELVGLLRLRQPGLLGTETGVERPGNLNGSAWGDWAVPEGVSRRVVEINGMRWLAIPAGKGVRPVLVRSDPDWDTALKPVFQEEWASFACIEEDSRVSGVSRWTLGLVAKEVIGEWSWLDEDGGYLSARRRRRRQEDEIVAWIQSVSADMNTDLAMFAVETLIGDLDGYQIPASYFDDDASDTMLCDLWVSGEADGLLRALRRCGRGDAVDAVVRPRSRAAARRAERRRYPGD